MQVVLLMEEALINVVPQSHLATVIVRQIHTMTKSKRCRNARAQQVEENKRLSNLVNPLNLLGAKFVKRPMQNFYNKCTVT